LTLGWISIYGFLAPEAIRDLGRGALVKDSVKNREKIIEEAAQEAFDLLNSKKRRA
jgi:hypothetical protein